MLAFIYVFTIWCLAAILYASVDQLEIDRRLALKRMSKTERICPQIFVDVSFNKDMTAWVFGFRQSAQSC